MLVSTRSPHPHARIAAAGPTAAGAKLCTGTSRCPENARRLNRVVALRADNRTPWASQARMKGAKGNMASSPDGVNAFLDRVVTRLKPKRDEDTRRSRVEGRDMAGSHGSMGPRGVFGRQIRNRRHRRGGAGHFPASEVVPATIKALGEDLFSSRSLTRLNDAQLWRRLRIVRSQRTMA